MRVTVRLHGILRDYRPADVKTDVLPLEFEGRATVLDAAQRLGIPRRVLHAAFLNDEQVGWEAALTDGDFLRLFPPVVGGEG